MGVVGALLSLLSQSLSLSLLLKINFTADVGLKVAALELRFAALKVVVVVVCLVAFEAWWTW